MSDSTHPALIDILSGAWPNAMTVPPITRARRDRQATASQLRSRLVHSDQREDDRISGDFFAQLGVPVAQVEAGIRSGDWVRPK